MATRNLDPADRAAAPSPARGPAAAPPERASSRDHGGVPTADALAGYLRAQATEFLRALRLHRETGPAAAAEGSADAARALRRSARRISGSLHTFRPLLEERWAAELRPELAWVSGTLAREYACQAGLDRLLLALHRLSGVSPLPPRPETAAGEPAVVSAAAGRQAGASAAVESAADPAGRARAGGSPGPDDPGEAPAAGPVSPPTASWDRGNLTAGAAKAGALLDRRLTLARTRAHSTALQALGSSRFHAVADRVAVLASDVPLTPAAATADLRAPAAAAEERLTEAVAALPLVTAGSPYNAEALAHGLSPDSAPHPQDAPWHQVRLLLRLHRYALEVLYGGEVRADVRLMTAGRALDRHRDASEAAAAAASAARTPRIAPATAYVLGVLHADQRHEVEAARFAFQQSWQKETAGAS
ncbi:CHAD domain-containing protein [Streptomyces sp. NPDC003697]